MMVIMDAFSWFSFACAVIVTFVLYFGFYLPTKREREREKNAKGTH